MSTMTLREKIGQMNQYNGFWDATGPLPDDTDAKQKYEHLKQGLVGSVLNVTGCERVAELQRIVVEESRLGIPLIFALDVIHGHKTLFPIPLAEAASWDLDLIEKSARTAAIEASARGINWTFAPMVDVSRDPRWGRVMEGAGEDPFLGQCVGAARVKGFQGEDLSRNDTIAACAKHFAGYGFSEAGRDYNLVDVGNYTLHNAILPPFKAAVDAGVKTIMNGFNTLNGIPVTAHTHLQREILKQRWGFSGFVVSDWASGVEMINHGFAKDLKHVAELAANAGSDMDMESYAYINHLHELVEQGAVAEHVVDDAVRRILRVKFELGLFDDPYRYIDADREQRLASHPHHEAAALDVARCSIVMLKNDNGILPLSKTQANLAVIGDLARDKNSPLGSWRFGAEDNTAISLLEALDQRNISYQYAVGAKLVAGGEECFTEELEINALDTSGFDEAIALAKNAESVILMLGEHCYQSGEARSRTQLGLPGVQQALLEAIYKVNRNIVLLVSNGRPLVLTWAAEHIPGILITWHLGSQSGHAIADVVFGDHNPSAKLPMSFPRSVGQIPVYYSQFRTGRPEANPEGGVFWSHYIDEKNDALFAFGFGLSYTSFEYSGLNAKVIDGARVDVSVTVKNTGERVGEEITQLYICDKIASLARPMKELRGFQKVSLAPDECRVLHFSLTEKELGFYNLKGEFTFEPGDFAVLVGPNSQSGIWEQFTI